MLARWIHILLYFLCALPLSAQKEAAGPTRLAVVSDSGAADLGTLMTGAISGLAEYHLLERDELARIGDERKLAAMALTQGSTLGKLAGSDGLLFLARENGQYRARLTAVHLGYALFDLIFAQDAEPDEVARRLANHLEPLAGKLALPPEKAIPLAVLNLRADSSSPEAIEVERNATLLLESQLSQIADIILLERRRPSALAFERTLAADTPALLRGVYLGDGNLMLSLKDNSLTASLRIRAPEGTSITTLEVTGSRDALPAFAKELVAQLSAALKLPHSHPSATYGHEAREYLHEGLWATLRGLYPAALAALDSAELLGETAPDLLAIRIPALCYLAATSRKVVKGDDPLPDHPEPQVAISHLQRAMADVIRYKEINGAANLQLSPPNPRRTFDGRTGELDLMVSLCSLKMLAMLDRIAHPAADRFRAELREFVQYDPLKGKIPRNLIRAIGFAGHLSFSREEETAFYRMLSTDLKWAAYPAWALQLHVKPDTFCFRFIPTEKERQEAFFAFWNALRDHPVAQPAAYFYLALWAAPEEKEDACRRFYSYLWNHREGLFDTSRLPFLLKYAFRMEKRRKVEVADAHLIDTLLYLLRSETPFKGPIEGSWVPELFPEERAPELWQAMQGHQKRVQARGAGTGYFQMFNRLFTERFGDQDATSRLPGELLVTRFWQPAHLKEMFSFNGHAFNASSEGVVIAGRTGGAARIYRITLPDLESTVLEPPEPLFPKMAVEHSGAIFLLASDLALANDLIWSYRSATGQWTRFPVPHGASRLYSIAGKLYLVIDKHTSPGGESGIALFDPETGESRLLASSRRRPAQNQFDEARSFRIGSLFEGPGGKAYAVLDAYAYLIREEPGQWPLINRAFIRHSSHQDRISLLQGQSRSGDSAPFLLLIDPLRKEPTLLTGPIHFVPSASAQEQPGWARRFRWPTGTKLDDQCQEYGLRGEDLIGLQTDGRNGRICDLLYYRPGVQKPIRIPLRFQMPMTKVEALKRALSPTTNTFEAIVNPRASPYTSMHLTPEGICIQAVQHGFWFIPFHDLDAYLEKSGGKTGPKINL